jgi:RNA-binding protein 25
LELQQLEALRKESEDFLNRQAEMFKKMGEGKRKTGGDLSLDENTPIKLSFGSSSKVEKVTEVVEERKIRERKVNMMDEDEEESGKRKRELVPLHYSDEEGSEDEVRISFSRAG